MLHNKNLKSETSFGFDPKYLFNKLKLQIKLIYQISEIVKSFPFIKVIILN